MFLNAVLHERSEHGAISEVRYDTGHHENSNIVRMAKDFKRPEMVSSQYLLSMSP